MAAVERGVPSCAGDAGRDALGGAHILAGHCLVVPGVAQAVTIAEMRRRYEDGATCAQIARVARCAESTVSRTLRLSGVQLRSRGGKNGWPVVNRTERLDHIADRYYGDGWTISEIAREIGRSRTVVWDVLRELGFPRRAAHGTGRRVHIPARRPGEERTS